MMSNLLRFVSLAAVAVAAVACGSSDEVGGRCIQSTGCFEVQDPMDYDVKTECEAFAGTWSAQTCDKAQYARKCTQTTDVNGKPVVYVYYWPTGSALTCLGTETNL